ncbi:MAG TPA: glycosyltransferase family 87 protein [Anaerolineales bacterium]|nr:glycosyltransferase family 87 protein [Anaerolineales bacterium]
MKLPVSEIFRQTDIQKSSGTKRLDFSMLSAWLMMSVTLAVIAFVVFGVDFRGYYAASRVLISGENPYDYRAVAQVLLDVTGEMGNNPYYYPPWFAWLFIPLVYLPFQVARAVWMILNVIIWSLGLWQLGRIIGWPQPGWRRYLLFTVTTFSFAWITWRYEQAAILVFAMWVALISSIYNEKWQQTGIWLALLLVKPNVTLIVIAGVTLWLLRQGRRRTVGIMLFTIVVLLSISTLITPNWFQPFFEDGFGRGLTVALDGPDEIVALRINTTFLDWMRTLGVEAPWSVVLYGVTIGISIFVFFRSVYFSRSFLELICILLLLSYAITPYSLQYDFPPLVIPLYWALSQCISSPKKFAIGITLAAFVCSVIFWQQNISWAYWMIIGLIALLIWAVVGGKSYLEAPNGISNNS